MFDVVQANEEDYGLIRPSLIKQLRSILDQYPDNGQILKVCMCVSMCMCCNLCFSDYTYTLKHIRSFANNVVTPLPLASFYCL